MFQPWPAALLLQRLKVGVVLVARGNSDGDLRVGPLWGIVVGAGFLVQSVPPVLAAEPVMAGTAAVDVRILGAVECIVKVPHDVEVAPGENVWDHKIQLTEILKKKNEEETRSWS